MTKKTKAFYASIVVLSLYFLTGLFTGLLSVKLPYIYSFGEWSIFEDLFFTMLVEGYLLIINLLSLYILCRKTVFTKAIQILNLYFLFVPVCIGILFLMQNGALLLAMDLQKPVLLVYILTACVVLLQAGTGIHGLRKNHRQKKICPHCGNSITFSDPLYCPHCGERLKQEK